MERPFPAYKGDDAYIFVSYSHADADEVYPEITWLKEAGINIWYDEGISAGRIWSEELASAIKGAAQFLYLATSSSITSKHCIAETNFALDADIPVLVVNLDETELPDGLQLRLNAQQGIIKPDHSESQYREKLLEVLRNPAERSGDANRSALGKRKQRKRSRLKLFAAGVAGLVAIFAVLLSIDTSREPPAPAPDPYSPTVFEDLSDWFTFLITGDAAPDSITDIAVLPFEDISEQPGNAFISDGLTDEIIGSLSKVAGLQVVARSSSLSIRNRHEDVRAIGAFLNVHAVVEGTVKRVGNTLRISSQLSSTADGYVLWSETYDRKLDDLLVLQDEIASSIVSALREKLALTDLQPPEATVAQPDMAAYQQYLNARFLGKLRGELPLRKSIALYEQALALDPAFTRASLGLANSIILLPAYSDEDEQQMFARALAILAGLDLASPAEAGEAEAIKGFIAFRRWQWMDAEAYFRKALVLAPNNPNLYIAYSQLLATTGRREDAVTAAQQARELDAVSPVVNNLLALAYLWDGDNVRATEQFAIAAEGGFNNLRNPAYLIFLMREQRFVEARRVIESYFANLESDPRWLMDNIESIATYSDDDELVAAAEGAVAAGNIPPRYQLGLWLFLDQPDQVYETVQRFRNQKKELDFVQLFSLEGEKFRDSDEFAQIVEEIGLDAYWEHYQGPDA